MSDIQSYRKKPLVVRAIQYDGKAATVARLRDEGVLIQSFPGGASGYPMDHVWNPGAPAWVPVHNGDYIILAPTGCRYPVKPEQFERNYEACDEA